ncbi:aldehyde dehydrogenase family protein [Nanoarchaeota archaeon]
MAYQLFIGGKWVNSSSGETFQSLNPTTGKSLGTFQKGNEKDIIKAIDSAEKAYPQWSSTPAPKRGEILLKAAQILRKRKKELSQLVTKEMGKVIIEGEGDVQEAIDICEYMAGEGRRLFGHTTTSELKNKFAMTIRVPVGVVACITPWNFPIAIPAWKITAALICGNTIVFKPSSDSPLCATKFVEVLEQAGLPKGVLNMVTCPGKAFEPAVKDKRVRCISFTGHKDTGKRITEIAGIKRISLELGSKNATVVMDDADLDLAVDGILWSAFGTQGQRCTACSRVIVHEKVKSEFEKRLVKRVKKIKIGDPLDHKTEMGPLVNKAQHEKVTKFLGIGKSEAKLLYYQPIKKGNYFSPAIFTDAKENMSICQNEIFGPILAIMTCKSLKHAIQIVNSVDYGLVSAIYTNDVTNAMHWSQTIETGLTYVNAPTIGAEVHLPFGGVKQSGHGKEAGIHGIDDYSDIKAVYFDYSGRLQRAQIDVKK